MSEIMSLLQNTSGLKWLIIVTSMLIFWFLPAGMAYFFNRKYTKIIFVACIPAGFSFLAWGALLVWATTGRALEKYLPEKVRQRIATES